jgi:environmental stress-induced protein Ves
MKTKIIKKDSFKTSLWSGGTTTELYIYPENSLYKNKDFLFRLSSATVELAESTFTPLEGIQRYIAPIDGSLKLFHQIKTVELKPYECYTFDGGIETTSKGKVTDFNLMLSKKVSGALESFFLEKTIKIKNSKEDCFLIYAPEISLAIVGKEKYHLSSGDLGIFSEALDLTISSDATGYFFLAKIQLPKSGL